MSVPRQVISVINGTSGNLRILILRGMARREGEGDGVSWEPVLCSGRDRVSSRGGGSGEVQCFSKLENSE